MTKIQAIKNSLIYILIILAYASMAFKVWWTNGNMKYLGVVSFIRIGIASLFFNQKYRYYNVGRKP